LAHYLHENDRVGVRLLAVLLLSSLAACGEALGPEYDPPYISISGVITSTSAVTFERVRVALLWGYPDEVSGEYFQVAQETVVDARFPVEFRLTVNSLPPLSAMTNADDVDEQGQVRSRSRYSTGTLIVYDDTNANGELDLLPLSARTSIDRVLGVAWNLAIIYVEGESTSAPMGLECHPGFNFFVLCPDEECQEPPRQLTASDVIEIALDPEEDFSGWICREYVGTAVEEPPCVQRAPEDCPIPEGAEIGCDSTRELEWFSCPSASLCDSTDCRLGTVLLAPEAAAPADWPCLGIGAGESL
jgi:hypothetical protein